MKSSCGHAAVASINRSQVSAILNLSDGMLADFMRLEVISTVNAQAINLDPALLRPGRLLCHRRFNRLEAVRARRLAEHLGRGLPRERTSRSPRCMPAGTETPRRPRAVHAWFCGVKREPPDKVTDAYPPRWGYNQRVTVLHGQDRNRDDGTFLSVPVSWALPGSRRIEAQNRKFAGTGPSSFSSSASPRGAEGMAACRLPHRELGFSPDP